MNTAAASLAMTTFGAYGTDIIFPQKSYRVGLIGTGWYGKSDLFRLIQVSPVDVVGLCDVDSNQLKEAATLVAQRQTSRKTPRLYADYRKMLNENEFDIILIGTPDHWHALQTIEAIKAGAHVYVQKPISVDVLEGEAMLDAARKFNRVVQVGTQRRSTPHLVQMKKDIIDTGMLGKTSHAEICCYYPMRNNDNPSPQPIPDYFDFEMWTGPAPMRTFDQLPHRGWWRAFMEYGNGIVGDMCIHMLDTVRWLLGLSWPKKIYSTGGIYVQKEGKSNISDTQTAVFEFDEFTCTWQHRTWGTPVDPEYPWAFFLYGEKGTLKGSVMKYEFIPNGDGRHIIEHVIYEKDKYPEDLKERGIELHAAPATRRHMLNFLAAIQQSVRPVADIEEGHTSTASCILANLSMQLGRPLSYDPANRLVTNDSEATALLRRNYRSPWLHPEPAKR